MNFLTHIKSSLMNIKRRLHENTFDSLVWLVNIVPSLAGFSLRGSKIKVPFWILHLSLLFYVYGVGISVFQVKYAHGAQDFIKSYVNMSLLALIANNSYWFLKKRPLILNILEKARESDQLSKSSKLFEVKHDKLMNVIKRILFVFYGFNYFDASFMYLPNRMDPSNTYSMTPCVGLEPLTSSPNREICMAILFTQEITIMMVVLNYQALLLLLIAHTAAMYELLSEEIMNFNSFENGVYNNEIVRKNLPSIVTRHVIILDTVDKLKSLYSMPIGVNFASNAICISLFFYLPLPEWVMFIPVLIYCFLVFFLYCFLGQRLINASEEFQRAVYSCGWENFQLKEMKMIYVMLLQSQRPVELLAADIIPVNIYTFATTLQAMFKFITVVKV